MSFIGTHPNMFMVMLLIAIFVTAFGLAALKMWLTGGRPEGAPDWW